MNPVIEANDHLTIYTQTVLTIVEDITKVTHVKGVTKQHANNVHLHAPPVQNSSSATYSEGGGAFCTPI